MPYTGLLVPRFQHVLHLVRQPLKQISSVTSHSNLTYDFIQKVIESTVGNEQVVTTFRKVSSSIDTLVADYLVVVRLVNYSHNVSVEVLVICTSLHCLGSIGIGMFIGESLISIANNMT